MLMEEVKISTLRQETRKTPVAAQEMVAGGRDSLCGKGLQ